MKKLSIGLALLASLVVGTGSANAASKSYFISSSACFAMQPSLGSLTYSASSGISNPLGVPAWISCPIVLPVGTTNKSYSIQASYTKKGLAEMACYVIAAGMHGENASSAKASLTGFGGIGVATLNVTSNNQYPSLWCELPPKNWDGASAIKGILFTSNF